MTLFKKPFFNLQGERYLAVLIVVAPLLNFLSGINTDLYAPSLPALSAYYHVSISAAKNTMTAGLFGFAFGAVIFGALFDIIGRRKVIAFGLLAFVITSFIAIFMPTIQGLMLVRFIQSMMVSTSAIGARTLVFDNFTGKRLQIAILYSSVAYGAGPVIAPFIGGVLQYHFGWKANFLAYMFFSAILLLSLLSFVRESLPKAQPFSLSNSIVQYKKVISQPIFWVGAGILGGVVIQQMIYPALGPFIVERVMNLTSIAYGNTALIIGCAYLLGTFFNRILMHRLSQVQLIELACYILGVAVILQFIFSQFFTLNLFVLIFPIALIAVGLGFVFSNVIGLVLQTFVENIGIATAAQTFALTFVAALGLLFFNSFHVTHLLGLCLIFGVVVVMQIVLFYGFLKRKGA